MPTDPLAAAADHHRIMQEKLREARAHEQVIKHLLVGRMASTELYATPLRITDVQVRGTEIHIYGRANPKRRRSILLAVQLDGIRLVPASMSDASSKEKA